VQEAAARLILINTVGGLQHQSRYWLACVGFVVADQSSRVTRNFRGDVMSLGTILLVILILMLLGVIPTWPHSRSWGYGPAGGLGLVLIIVIVLLLLGRL
jgi:hypothetical protein